MGWFSDLFKSDFDKLIENGTDEELESDYERRRQEWLSRGQDGTGEKTPEMKRLGREMSRRSAERWQKDPGGRWFKSSPRDQNFSPELVKRFRAFSLPWGKNAQSNLYGNMYERKKP